jgi:hypothetical protein
MNSASAGLEANFQVTLSSQRIMSPGLSSAGNSGSDGRPPDQEWLPAARLDAIVNCLPQQMRVGRSYSVSRYWRLFIRELPFGPSIGGPIARPHDAQILPSLAKLLGAHGLLR